VPCHNYGRFLFECVASVTAQSHRDLRVLVIDDASTDITSAVCASLAADDPRVLVRRHPVRRGATQTFNEGLDWADGDYLLLLSADDFLLPGALQRAVEVLDAQPEVGLIYGAYVRYDMSARLPYQAQRAWRAGRRADPTLTISEQAIGGAAEISLDPAALVARLGKANHVCVATAISRTSVQKRLGNYREDLPHSGDLEIWVRFALYSKVVYLETLQAVQRVHGDNMSRRYEGFLDFQQCVQALRIHYPGIRERLPQGRLVEARIRRRVARRAVQWSTRALRQGDIARSYRLLRFALRERFLAGDFGQTSPEPWEIHL